MSPPLDATETAPHRKAEAVSKTPGHGSSTARVATPVAESENDTPTAAEERCSVEVRAPLAAVIARIVDRSPPLSAEQRGALASLLSRDGAA